MFFSPTLPTRNGGAHLGEPSPLERTFGGFTGKWMPFTLTLKISNFKGSIMNPADLKSQRAVLELRNGRDEGSSTTALFAHGHHDGYLRHFTHLEGIVDHMIIAHDPPWISPGLAIDAETNNQVSLFEMSGMLR